MAIETNLAIRNKYIDLDLEDCVLPQYLSKQFAKSLAQNTLPNMVFTGNIWEPKTIIANALAKEVGASLLAVNFNKEPKIKTMQPGERSLTVLRMLLRKHTAEDNKKVFIIEDLKNFPRKCYGELFKLIDDETFHHFIFYSNDKAVNQHIKYYPQISFEFKIDHSELEEEGYWEQCQNLLNKFKKTKNISELKLIIKTTYFFWLSLLGRETLNSLRKELEIISLNPVKEPIKLNPVKRPIRLYPPVKIPQRKNVK
jgi:hypothetical protein